jgi:hypothetical protein
MEGTPESNTRILWSPAPPSAERGIIDFPIRDVEQKFNLCLNIDFGKRSSSLERIIAIMGTNYSPILGIEFCYSDGFRELFGRKTMKWNIRYEQPEELCVEVSFPIDAKNGELVSSVNVLHSGYVYAIQVSRICPARFKVAL